MQREIFEDAVFAGLEKEAKKSLFYVGYVLAKRRFV